MEIRDDKMISTFLARETNDDDSEIYKLEKISHGVCIRKIKNGTHVELTGSGGEKYMTLDRKPLGPAQKHSALYYRYAKVSGALYQIRRFAVWL